MGRYFFIVAFIMNSGNVFGQQADSTQIDWLTLSLEGNACNPQTKSGQKEKFRQMFGTHR